MARGGCSSPLLSSAELGVSLSLPILLFLYFIFPKHFSSWWDRVLAVSGEKSAYIGVHDASLFSQMQAGHEALLGHALLVVDVDLGSCRQQREINTRSSIFRGSQSYSSNVYWVFYCSLDGIKGASVCRRLSCRCR